MVNQVVRELRKNKEQRKKALEAKGIEKTQVVVVDLTLKKEKALNVTLNNQMILGLILPSPSAQGRSYLIIPEVDMTEDMLHLLEI